MPLPPKLKQHVEEILAKYCEEKIPERVKDKIRLLCKLRGNSVTLIESRPYYMDHSRWTETNIAQFRFNPETENWLLYWQDSKDRWHLYENARPTKKFSSILKKVDEDQTGVFWG